MRRAGSNARPNSRSRENAITTEAEEAECVEQLAVALADDTLARSILPRGSAVGVETTLEHVYAVGGHTVPRATTRATSVQLRGGSTFSIAELIRLKLVKGMRWKGPR